MHTTGLPPELRGDWIWRNDCQALTDAYVLFRREFIVTETPGTAELWIAAHTDFHLYVNGRHFCRGANTAVGNGTYVHYLDIGFCMEIGRNVIAVVAHNVDVVRSGRQRRFGGLWLQLNVDGQPLIATEGDEWRTARGDYYANRQPRQSQGTGFVENVDLRKYPDGWYDIEFDATKSCRRSARRRVTRGSRSSRSC